MTPVEPTLVAAVKGELLRQGVALDARFAAELGPGRRARLSVTPCAGGTWDVAIVAVDYFSELSLLCGLLAAHDLDIETGYASTLGPEPPLPARVIDVFRVRPRDGRPPDPERLEHELVDLLDLAATGRGPEARERLNLRLADTLGSQGRPDLAAAPVTIRFDEPPDPTWTAMDVSGPDARGFLYTLANGLALRGIYIHGVLVESVGQDARDRFLVAHPDGKRLASHEQESLGQAVALIRQFTHFLPWAPDPARALRYFDQFLDRVTPLGPDALQALATPESLLDLARLLGSSVFLWEDVLRQSFDRLLPVLAAWRARPPRSRAVIQAGLRSRLEATGPADWARVVSELKEEETLLVETRRLLDERFSLEEFATALTDLGEALVAEAARAAQAGLTETHGRPLGPGGDECPCAVLALGKFGGREMGYASDLELLFVYDEAVRTERTGFEGGRYFDDLVRETVALLAAPEQALFRPDLRLRPHGNKGPLASPLDALRAYYRPQGGAAPFERQALIKLRFVAGDESLGRRVLELRDAFVWSDEPWDRDASLRLRDRQTRELVPAGRFNVKLSRGGLVDAEYAVQYLQIQNGRERPELRTPSTLLALDGLAAAGLVSTEEHADLRLGYLFWRQVADALRVVRGQSGDLLLPPVESDDYAFLARRLGYSGTRHEAAQALAAEVDRHRERLAALYDRRFRYPDAASPTT